MCSDFLRPEIGGPLISFIMHVHGFLEAREWMSTGFIYIFIVDYCSLYYV
jgi:hypothetical protein